MKYKTVIELVSEADNPQDAADLAGEYLVGHIHTGVSMKCSTRKQIDSMKPAIVLATVVSILVFCAALEYRTNTSALASKNISFMEPMYAVNPPLKTGKIDTGFNDRWDKKSTRAALRHINQ